MVPTFGYLIASATRAERTRLQEPCCQTPVKAGSVVRLPLLTRVEKCWNMLNQFEHVETTSLRSNHPDSKFSHTTQ